MKRLLVLAMLTLGLAATATNAESGWFRFRSRPTTTSTASASPSPAAASGLTSRSVELPGEYRTHCVGWASAQDGWNSAQDGWNGFAEADTTGPGAGGSGSHPTGANTLGVAETRALVWVLDGAGDLKGCSNALGSVNSLVGSPVELAVFAWSHGYRRLLRDQIDMKHARSQGARLAEAIRSRQWREPGRRVVIVAHSAGCAVALAAGDVLPDDAVDRIILLAPSVSTGYDIRPTLRSAREGLDVFCSTKDWVALGFVVRVVGTTDARWGAAAGRWGFQPRGANALTAFEASRLRQHFWTQELAWTGHTGGHHGMHAPEFVRNYLLPLMIGG